MPKASDFSAIYGIRHIASGRIYVGSAVRTNARWRHHRSQPPGCRRSGMRLTAAGKFWVGYFALLTASISACIYYW